MLITRILLVFYDSALDLDLDSDLDLDFGFGLDLASILALDLVRFCLDLA